MLLFLSLIKLVEELPNVTLLVLSYMIDWSMSVWLQQLLQMLSQMYLIGTHGFERTTLRYNIILVHWNLHLQSTAAPNSYQKGYTDSMFTAHFSML